MHDDEKNDYTNSNEFIKIEAETNINGIEPEPEKIPEECNFTMYSNESSHTGENYLNEETTKKEEEPIEIHIEEEKPKKKMKKGKTFALVMSGILLVSAGFGGGYLSSKWVDNGVQQSKPVLSVADKNDTTGAAKDSEAVVKTSSANHGQLSVAEIAKRNANAVVEINTELMATNPMFGQYITEGAGSGVIITNDGYIMTNNHVIDGANKITVRLKNGETYGATLIGRDAQTDIAVIKIEEKDLQYVTFGNSDNLEVGELAVAIGNPLGQLGGTVTDGIISALDREITIDGETRNLLQTNAAINRGNSGGGLFNASGDLIGLVVAKSAGTGIEGIGFAIPSNDVQLVVDEIINHGYVTGRPALGVSLLNISSQQEAMMYRVNQTGVYIAQVTIGSSADKAGLQIGDCVLSANGKEIKTSSELKDVIKEGKVGSTVELKILRDRKELNVKVELGEANPNA